MATTPDGEQVTLEWFGATTFRLKANGITMFLDAWLERPRNLKTYLRIDEVTEADYIFISHAHFDHLPGADRLARQTGAIIVGNGEAINVMRAAGVPEAQLLPVAGGERIPLFSRSQRDKAIEEAAKRNPPGPPGAPGAPNGHGPPPGPPGPPMPDASEARITVHAWPSLHCLATSADHRDIPETIDTGTVYTGSASHACTIDLTRGLTYGLGGLLKAPSIPDHLPGAFKQFLGYMKDREAHQYSFFDGGQIMYNFLLGDQTILWNGHLGAYQGIMKMIQPQPNVAILGIAGRANLDGRPFDGSAADFITQQIQWLGEPDKVIWCLHDEGPLPPKRIDTRAATSRVEENTKSKVIDLEHEKLYTVSQLGNSM